MKIPQLASLTATAALLLHFGSFVQANPMFVEIPPAHNDASVTTCEGIRITYPAGNDITFGNDTKHVVAWSVPSFVSQVNLTLVGQDHTSFMDILPAESGASNTPFTLSNGAQAGEYHVHLATIGGEQSCETDSSPFKIEASTQTQQPEDDDDDDDESSESHSDKSWDAMLTQLGEYVDKDDEKKAESHEDAAPQTEDEKTDSFEAYIKSLDMEYKPYIEKNKDSQSDVVTHKNSGADLTEEQHDDAANPYFTNDDQRTHADSHSDAADSYFTNDDQRTRTTAHLNAELDQLSHTDAPFFQGNGGDPSIKTQKLASELESTLESDEGDEGWTVEEYPYPPNEWLDESDDIPNHTDEGEWMAEEVDPSAIVHSDAKEWTEETSTKSPFDHSNVGTWSAEEIDDTPEPKVAKEHSNADGWVESQSSHSNEDDIPDHSDDSEWHIDEVDFEYDAAAHTDKAQGDWVETDSSHADDVNGWTEQTSTTTHRNSDWKEETSTTAHRNSDWKEETSTTAHRDSDWKEETSTTAHRDSDWQEETSTTTHRNSDWQEESSESAHRNSDWKEETSTTAHRDSDWQEETSTTTHRNSDWQEETSSTHRDGGNWREDESDHPDGSGWQSEASDEQHYDDNVLIYAAEDFIN